MIYYSTLTIFLGEVGIVADEAALLAIALQPSKCAKLASLHLSGHEVPNLITETAATQLGEYFAGNRRQFDLPVRFNDMSEFATEVLQQLITVPYGTTVSYGELAAASGRPKAARAIGRVMAANPIPIVVPCHRVVGAAGQMTGYSGGEGITTKSRLLALEQENI